MKRLINILLAVVILPVGLSAQDYLLLKGQTRDTTLAPVAFANVMAVDTLTKEMTGFAVTDVKGNFQFRLKKNKVYELQVTFVGFVPIKEYVRLEEAPENPLMLIMREAVNALDQVTVVAEMPVLVRGDTISYKAEAFMKGDERKLEDVLAELPGFNIRDNGDIEVQGKRVDKVLVDGKEFFEGDTKLATKNIPADVVDRVQVLQNFNDIAPMQGLVDDDRLALNIELKRDKKRIVFGDVEAGGGPEERYFGHANSFYYAPKTSINFIGDANNVGELALTLNDYFRMSGGMASMAGKSGTSFRFNAGEGEIPLTDRNSASDLSNRLAAANFTMRPTDKWQFSGFGIGFDNEVLLGSNSFRTYPQINNQTQEQLATASMIANRSGLGRFAVKYTPNYNLQVDYSFFGKRSAISRDQLRNSELLSGDNNLEEQNDLEPSSQTHQMRMFNALDEKNIISAEVAFTEEKNISNQQLTSEIPLFSNFLSDSSSFLLQQDQAINSRRLNGAFNYYHIFNNSTHISVGAGINVARQELQSVLNNEKGSLVGQDQQLDITHRFARFQYKKKWNRFTFRPGLTFNSYTVNDGNESPIQSQYVFPKLNVNYEFGSSHELEINYQQSLEYNEIGAYATDYRLERYNTLLLGSSGLDPAVYHSINLDYRNFNMYNFFNIFGGIIFQYIKGGFTNNQQLQGVENVLLATNAQQANQVLSGYLNLEKRFDHFRMAGSANLSKTQLNNELEGVIIENDNFTQQYGLNLSARLFRKWSVRSGYRISMNRYESGNFSNKFLNHRPSAGSTLTVKGFRFETEYAYNRYVNQSQNQETSFATWDASISYRKKKSPWEFKVQGLNLLDTRDVRRDSFSDNLISTYSYEIQQRYGLLTVKYDL